MRDQVWCPDLLEHGQHEHLPLRYARRVAIAVVGWVRCGAGETLGELVGFLADEFGERARAVNRLSAVSAGRLFSLG